MTTAGTDPARLVVLVSVAPAGPQTNPYITQLLTAIGADADVVRFSFRRALLGRWDVFHVHWPESTLRRAGRATTLVRTVLFALVLLRARVLGRPVVRTRHNIAPHESGSRLERAVLALGNRWTSWWITLTPAVGAPDGASAEAVTVIPHGHYRDWFAAQTVPDPVAGRVVFFGLVRPYKGVEELVAAMRATDDPQLSLHIAGRVTDERLGHALRTAADADERIVVRAEYLSDADLAVEIGQARLAVLPYRHMVNSGAVLLALSLGRPVLVPDTPVMRDLADEVGPGWVHLFTDRVDAADLTAALAAVMPTDAVRFADREWPESARAHLSAYRDALAATRTSHRTASAKDHA